MRQGMRQVRGQFIAAMAMAAAAMCVPLQSWAIGLDLPANSVSTGSDERAADQVIFPLEPRTGSGGQGLIAEGRVTRQAWELPDATSTPFQILSPLVAQLEATGFELKFNCRDRDCGGFDFRMALDLLPAPAMHVDLGDFRYVFAQRDGPQGAEVVALLASRSEGGGHLHLTLVTPVDSPDQLETKTVSTQTTRVLPDRDLAEYLTASGRAVLDDLSFKPGSSELGDGPFASLQALAEWMKQNADATIVLVGHSDNVGGLNDNIRLSERRAAAVAGALGSDYGVERTRISARGVGFLSPRASNATDEGRRLNRRVEAVVANR